MSVMDGSDILWKALVNRTLSHHPVRGVKLNTTFSSLGRCFCFLRNPLGRGTNSVFVGIELLLVFDGGWGV